MKNKFVLPEQWCIIGKNEYEYDKINNYARLIGGEHWINISNYAKTHYLHVDNYKYKYGMLNIDNGYTEITFQQFQQYVLNENSDNHIKLINILKYINEKTRTLT